MEKKALPLGSELIICSHNLRGEIEFERSAVSFISLILSA